MTLPVIDMGSGVPIHVQVERQIRQIILHGAWVPGSSIPSVRVLASELGINPNTAARAYRNLESQGVLTTVPGGGTFVADPLHPALDGDAFLQLRPDVERLVRAGQYLEMSREDVIAAVEWEWHRQLQAARTKGGRNG
ncbi:MAG TPA: GntR family transcriptional regulator [Terracidiphilus sp.]|nr:GntR family transcriptional regulator [Terracidiphilus sp.]